METWTNQGILLEQFPPTLAMVATCWLEMKQGHVRKVDNGLAANQSVNVSIFDKIQSGLLIDLTACSYCDV